MGSLSTQELDAIHIQEALVMLLTLEEDRLFQERDMVQLRGMFGWSCLFLAGEWTEDFIVDM